MVIDAKVGSKGICAQEKAIAADDPSLLAK
jgi:hypothetical protein